MPLARILTFHPEDAAALSQQLERLGFDVEVANPSQEQFARTDLEIEFAICEQHQVLARAAAIAAQLGAEVVVFPGAIPPLPEPTRVVAEVPVPISAPREILDQPREAEPRHGQREFDMSQLPAGTWFTSTGKKLRKIGKQAATGCSILTRGLLSGIERLRLVIGSGLAKLKTGVFTAAGSIAERTRGYQQRVKLRAAEARPAQKQGYTELEGQRAGTLGQESREAEHVAATYQQQLQTHEAERERRLAEMDRLRAEAREQVAALERARLAAETEQQRLQQYSEPSARRRRELRPQASQLRGVLTGAVAASLLFIVGMLLANFHPSTPLPVSITNSSIEQQRPFGATTVRGTPGVTLGGAKSRRPAPGNRAGQPVPSAAPLAKPQPLPSSAPVVRPKAPRHRFRQRPKTAQDNVTADDVVVRHYPSQQKPIARNTQQQAGLKHYSDQ
jgi:hypothetical protein